jgi:hypothetical protein
LSYDDNGIIPQMHFGLFAHIGRTIFVNLLAFMPQADRLRSKYEVMPRQGRLVDVLKQNVSIAAFDQKIISLDGEMMGHQIVEIVNTGQAG